MSFSFRPTLRPWFGILLLAAVFLIGTDFARVKRIQHISDLAENSIPDVSAAAANGTAKEVTTRNRLIVPEHDDATYEWLNETRTMVEQGQWRLRRVTYENAPAGHLVHKPSVYRWWLASVAWLDRQIRGRGESPSIEDAALVADPILHLLLLIGVVIYTARKFGPWSAGLSAVALVALFPFAAEFLPGLCSDRGMAQIASIASLLIIGAGTNVVYSKSPDARKRARKSYFLAGLVGGIGAWISVWNEIPLIFGLFLGGLISIAYAHPPKTSSEPLDNNSSLWRLWAVGGALAVLITYLIEYFPAHLKTWEFHAVHPLYATAWLGLGEILARVSDWREHGKRPRTVLDLFAVLAALGGIAALIVAMKRFRDGGFLEYDFPALRLERLPNGPSAPNFGSWIIREGFTPLVWITLLPTLAIIAASYFFFRNPPPYSSRRVVGVLLGPAVVMLVMACWQLHYWNDFDAAVVALMVVSISALAQNSQKTIGVQLWCAGAVAVFVLGLCFLVPTARSGGGEIGEPEFLALIERDLARWIVNRAGAKKPTVLSPHSETVTLYYYGNLPGLATLSRENRDGFEVAMRVVSASTPEESKELIDKRGVEYIIIPSWDSYLDTYARAGMGQLEGTFLYDLHNWKVPNWLQPIAYQLPNIPGFEGQAVTIFQVVEEQDDSVALSRTAEYFVEMGQFEFASKAAQALRRFPADLGALVARAQVEGSQGDTESFIKLVEQLRPRLKNGSDRSLPWDRRISLAVILARAKHVDLARVQVQRCLTDATDERLRSLSTGELYHLLVLARVFHLSIEDPFLRSLSLSLLPIDLQERLGENG